jgi:ferric-dicitrate binding protein FerR (iron transport regulator)
VWSGIKSGMARPGTGENAAVRPRTVAFRPFLRPGRWAAVLTGLLLLAGAGYFATQRYYLTITQATAYGELRTLTLPDSSTVTLNGNTRLRYARFWPAGQARRVWLEGEAYFDVRHLGGHAPRARFVVHTARAEVEVLGTRFNVTGRSRRTRVVLESGKVQLTVREARHADRLVMQPGDLVELAETGQPALRKVDPGKHAAWRRHRIVLDNTSLAEIAQLIEDNYGRRVVVRAGAATGKRLSGSVPSNNLNVLLKALSQLFGLNITRQADQIIIDAPPANTH